MNGEYIMSLNKRNIGKKFNKQFHAKKKMDSLAAFDEEYAHSHDMKSVLNNLDGYNEYISDRNGSGSDWY